MHPLGRHSGWRRSSGRTDTLPLPLPLLATCTVITSAMRPARMTVRGRGLKAARRSGTLPRAMEPAALRQADPFTGWPLSVC